MFLYLDVLSLRELDVVQTFEKALLCYELLNILHLEDDVFEREHVGLGFEAIADGQGCLQYEEVAIVEEAVPDSAGKIELEDVGVDGHDPFEEEDAATDTRLDEDLVQPWELFLHHSHEYVEDYVNLIHVEAVKVEEHVFSVHHVGEDLECFQFRAIVKQQTSSNVAHPLNISKVWTKQAVSQEHIS